MPMDGSGSSGRTHWYFLWHFAGFPLVPISFPLGYISSSPSDTTACFSWFWNLVSLRLYIPVLHWWFQVELELFISFLWYCFSGKNQVVIHEKWDRCVIGAEASIQMPVSFLPVCSWSHRVLRVWNSVFGSGASFWCFFNSTILGHLPWILVLVLYPCQSGPCIVSVQISEWFVVPHALTGCSRCRLLQLGSHVSHLEKSSGLLRSDICSLRRMEIRW